MNLRCTYCQTPFTIGRMEKLAAIQRMIAEELHHYDVLCPHCRRANPVSLERLQIFTPGWQEGLRTLEAGAAQMQKEAPAAPAPVAAPPVEVPAPVAKKRHHPKPAVKAPPPAVRAAKPVAKAKPAAKPVTKVKPAAKPAAKAVAKAKPAPKAKKPAAKAKSSPKGTKKPAARKK